MPRYSRIALYSTALGVTAGLVLAYALGARPARYVAAEEGPWIPLPRSGEDTGSWDSRWVLIHRSMHDLDPEYHFLPRTSLPMRCGEGEKLGQRVPDEYVATIGDHEDGSVARRWRVEFSVWGEDIAVRTSDLYARVSDELSIEQRIRGERLRRIGKESFFSRQQLAPIARLWQQPGLWHEPQGHPQCADGRMLVLEACVAGRYAIRDRTCGSDGRGPEKLWQEIQKLPAPSMSTTAATMAEKP